MDNPEETAWVFDSLVGFLHGPVWNAPLQTFIEEKSLSMQGIISNLQNRQINYSFLVQKPVLYYYL